MNSSTRTLYIFVVVHIECPQRIRPLSITPRSRHRIEAVNIKLQLKWNYFYHFSKNLNLYIKTTQGNLQM